LPPAPKPTNTTSPHDTFTTYIDQGRDETLNGRKLPPTLTRIVAGAAAARIHKQVATSHTSRLPHVHPELLYLVLLPYVGREEAQQQVQRARAQ
jgi:hypothetical protein